jgi:hypothetical protein
MIGQNKGFSTEEFIKSKINELKFSEIEINLQSVLKTINPDIGENEIFKAEKKEGKGLGKKTDLFVFKSGERFTNLSIKSGSGNSVHQENVYEFVKFLEKLGAKEEMIMDFLFVHWGDGTHDGTGKIEDRKDAPTLKKEFPKKIVGVQQLFKHFKEEIITRALLGNLDGTEPDNLIYISKKDLKTIAHSDMSKIIKFHMEVISMHADLKIGNLNYQNWNRCLGGQERTTKKHRNDIQFKWPNINRDLDKINDK